MNKNNFMKKLLAVIILMLFISVGLYGCQSYQPSKNAITMSISAYENGVTQSFSMPAGTDYYREKGQTDQAIERYVEDLEAQVRSQLWNNMYLNYYAIYLKNPIEEFSLNGDLVKIKAVSYNSVTDSVNFSFSFGSYEAWRYYHPSNESGEQDQDDQPMFLEIDVSKGTFPFSQLSNGQPAGFIYYDVIYNAKLKIFSKEDVDSEEKPIFVYSYGTTHKRIHSNADYVYEDGLYYHVWQVGFDELANENPLELYTVNAVRGWWYLIALASALAVAGIGMGIFVFIERKKKKNKKSD